VNPANLTLGLAFLAGFISFVSPCVLPLVPAYIGYMGGRVTNVVATQVASGGGQAVLRPSLNTRFTTFLHGVAFVAGFAFVFVMIGLLSTAFLQQIGGRNINLVTGIIGRLGGVLIIFFGLHFMGILPSILNRLLKNRERLDNPFVTLVMGAAGTALLMWGFTGNLLPSLTVAITTTVGDRIETQWTTIIALMLVAGYWLWLILGGAFTSPASFWAKWIAAVQTLLYSDTRRQMTARGGQGYGGSALMGVIFSAGWTPCIGPVYGAVLTLAANTGDVARAGPLLLSYVLGLGVPFLATALLLDSAQGLLRKLQRHMRKIELVSGAFLILIGYLVASNTLQNLSQSLAGQFTEFSTNVENSIIDPLLGGSAGASAGVATPVPTVIPTPTVEAVRNNFTNTAASTNNPVIGTSVNNIAPDFEGLTDSGQGVKLSALRGQVVLVNFWATWCGPCRVEMPELEKAYRENSDKGFTILAVNNQESVEDAVGFREELGLSFPIVMDEKGDLQKKYGVFAYPSTYVINRRGVIIARQFGPMTAKQIDELVTKALA
jgi:cytochrome c biogenesis protein CcdA/peroxiredoxin